MKKSVLCTIPKWDALFRTLSFKASGVLIKRDFTRGT